MKITIITKDETKTKFMQCCDMFEKWKVVLGTSGTIEVKTDIENKKIIDKMISEKGPEVIALFDDNGNGWFNDEIKSVSDGHNWTIFEDMLIKLGYNKLS